MGLFSKIGEGLRKTRGSLMNSVNSMLKAFGKVDDELFEELEEILIAGDVGINTSSRICEELRRRAKEQNIKDAEQIRGLLREIVAEMLTGDNEMHLTTTP